MKKSLFVLTAALSFGFASAQTATPAAPATATPAATPAAAPAASQVPTLTDVPAGHWAKDAIDRLVSQGIILGYPDGTYRGTQNLTRYEAAVILARLLDQVRQGQVNPGNLSPETLTSLQNAIQELAADLTALGVRVSDLEENAVNREDFTRLEARVEQLATASGDANAIAQLQSQIADLTARADDYDALRADIDDNASSIAALNDLTVLLNQDILNLQDRVSAVESAQADFVQRADFDNLAGRVGTIDTRVTTLENAPRFTVVGTINAVYGNIARTSGIADFDVDRLTRQTFADGVFSTGVNCPNGVFAASGNPVSCIDTNNRSFVGDSEVAFGVRATNLRTANGQITVNSAELNFNVDNEVTQGSPLNVTVGSAAASGTIAGQQFDVRYESSNSKFKFNDYLFANDNDTEEAVPRRGFVVNVTGNPADTALQPKATVVVGNANTAKLDSNNGAAQPRVLQGNYYGVRFSVNPANFGTVGVSFAQNDNNRSALGVDYNLGFGARNAEGNAPFNVTGAYVASIPQTVAPIIGGGDIGGTLAARDQAFFTNATADLGIARFGANFRAIDPEFAAGVAGMSANDSNYYYGQGANGYKSSAPYIADQVGFGAGVGTNLGPVALAAFGDTYVPYIAADDAPRNTSFGVSAGARLGALSLVGFFNRATQDDALISADLTYAGPDGNGFLYNSSTPYMDVADVPFAFSSTFGARLRHDGTATNALIRGLNITGAYARFYEEELGANDFQVYADYSGNVFGVQVQPFARYHLFTTPNNAAVTDTGNTTAAGGNLTAATYNTVKYGVKLSTQPLTAVPLQPSVFVNFANRITNYGDARVEVAGDTTTELFGQAGVTFNRFLAPNLSASLGYAYYQGFNVASTTVGSSASAATATYSAASDRIYASPFSSANTPFAGDNAGLNSGRSQGLFAQVSWNGLSANYGVFYNDDFRPSAPAVGTTPAYNNTGRSIAQGFKVAYTFRF
ncbi:S-layer homology domain-containing protein [Deinococcus planocerae]|uniref:S-layer homology domain-containing protein n=1 Tax=Deinococcus planocerae TaxID=1737569 RepID=UPI000C7F7432|nr:S-layer homology domain-containing protein [Deinococcus planocerae]